MKKEKERLLWLDYTKLIGIYFVILSHIHLDSSNFNVWMFSFHMPLFFILSGITARKEDSIKSFFIKNLKTLIVPYAFFYLIAYIWWLPAGFWRHPELYSRDLHDAVIKPFLGFILAEGRDTALYTNVNIPLWFFIGLFFCRLLFQIILCIKYDKRISLIAASIGSFVLVFIIHKLKWNIYFSIDSAIMALPFFALGYLLKDQIRSAKNNQLINIFGGGFLLFIGVLLCLYNGRVDLNAVDYGKNLFVFYLNGFVAATAIILLSRVFSKISNRLISYLAMNTLIIFATHKILTTLVIKAYYTLSNNVDPDIGFSVAAGAIVSGIVVTVSFIPIFLVRKFFPSIVGVSSKMIA